MKSPAALLPMRRNRDFMILWSGGAVSALGSSMSVLVFPLVAYAVTGSTVEAGLVTGAIMLGQVLLRLPAGALVDRWPRDRSLGVANAVGAVAYASLAVAALGGHLTIAHLVVVGLVSGSVDAFVSPAASAAVRTVVPAEELPQAFSQNQARSHAARLVGPPLGGGLLSVGRGLPFLVDAVSYAYAAISVRWIRTPLPAPAHDGRRSLLGDVGEGMRFMWHQAAVRAVILWGGAINFSVDMVLVTITLRLVRAGTHPAAIGAVETIAAVAGLVGAFVAPALLRRMRTGVMTITTGLVLALVVVPTALTDDPFAIGAFLAVGFFLLPANNSGAGAYSASVVPDRLQGRVNAASGFVANAASPLAPVVAGVLVSTTSGRTATLVGAALTALSLVPLVATPALRTLGRPDEWARPEASDAVGGGS